MTSVFRVFRGIYAPMERLACPATVALVLAGVGWMVWANWAFTTDDAYISVRYAQNLVQGSGLVWNPGEPPVEGYSNFSFVLISAAALAMGVDPILALKLAGLLGLLGTLAALWLIGRRWLSPIGALIAPVILATYLGTVFWSTSGLETAVYQFLLTAAFAALLWGWSEHRGRLVAAGLLFCLAGLTRPEAPAIAILAVAIVGGRSLLTRSGRRAALQVLIPLGTSLVAYYMWKWRHFGSILPNSFACKMETDGDPMALIDAYRPIAALPFVLALASRFGRSADGAALVMPSLIYMAMLYGADDVVAYHNRLTLPAYGLLLVAGVVATIGMLTRRLQIETVRLELPLLALAAIVFVYLIPGHVDRLGLYATRYAQRMEARERVGDWLRQQGSESARYVVGDVGIISLKAGGTSVDAFCLNNREMTQEPGGRDPERFAKRVLEEQKVDFLVIASTRTDRLALELYSLKMIKPIVTNPAFASYELALTAPSFDGDTFHYFVYRRHTDAPAGARSLTATGDP